MFNQPWFETVKWAVPVGLATILAWLMAFFRSPFNADYITNPDALVRLERIRQWMAGGVWFDPALLRVSTSEGQVLHWSRPLDLLTAVFAWPLSLFFDLSDAVVMGAMGLSFVAQATTVAFVFWVIHRCFQAPAWAAALAGISFLILTDMMAMFAASSWPDHHGLMALLFVVSLGLSVRMVERQSAGLTFGLVQGLAIWVSPESLIALLGLYSGLGLVWLGQGDDKLLKQCYGSTIGLVGVVLLALVVEYGLDWPGFALDRLSAFSLLGAFVLFGFWAILRFLPQGLLASGTRRGGFVLVLAGLGVGTVVAIVPQALGGPMAEANPWFVKSWGGMFGDSFRLQVWDGWVLVGAALAVLLVRRSFITFALLSPILVLSVVLSLVDSTRWITYGETVAILVLVLGFAQVWPRLQDLGDRLVGVLARAGALTGFIVAPMILSLQTEAPKTVTSPISTSSIQSVTQPCTVQSLLPVLQSQPKTRLLAHPNVTPALLYYSQHDVMSVPIHPNGDAVRDSVRILMATDDDQAKALLGRYGIGLVVMCPTGHEEKAYGTEPSGLYARTLRGEGPNWLRPVETGESVFRVWQVKK